MPRDSRQVGENLSWAVDTFPSLSAGVNLSAPDDLIDDQEATAIVNLSIRDGRVRSDSGFGEFGANTTLRGTPKAGTVYRNSSGVETFVLITDSTVYKYFAGTDKGVDQFHYIRWADNIGGRAGNGFTTLDANENGGQTVISVAATDRFLVDDYVGIQLNDGTEHQSKVTAISAGATITIEDALPGDSGSVVASSGREVTLAVPLTGDNANQVVTTCATKFCFACS